MDLQFLDLGHYVMISPPQLFDVKTIVKMKEIVQKSMDAGRRIFVFNLSFCNFMDSSTIALLANILTSDV